MLKIVLLFLQSLYYANIVNKLGDFSKIFPTLSPDLIRELNLSPVAMFVKKDCPICNKVKVMFKERKICFK